MTLPGPGDPETWPAYTGHPNDPRRGSDITEVIEHMLLMEDWEPCEVCNLQDPCDSCVDFYIESKKEEDALRKAGIE